MGQEVGGGESCFHVGEHCHLVEGDLLLWTHLEELRPVGGRHRQPGGCLREPEGTCYRLGIYTGQGQKEVACDGCKSFVQTFLF